MRHDVTTPKSDDTPDLQWPSRGRQAPEPPGVRAGDRIDPDSISINFARIAVTELPNPVSRIFFEDFAADVSPIQLATSVEFGPAILLVTAVTKLPPKNTHYKPCRS